MDKRGFNQRVIAGILVALIFGVALYIRVALPYDQVFVGDWIKFTGVDAYFFMRLVDNLVNNFPHLITFDPYYLYPAGSFVGIRSFYVYLLAGITWLIGLGSPTQHTIDVVGIYFPAVLGALTTIPVYFIGKALFNRWAGVIAAGLIAIFPGEFLGRSVLGFTDYHIAEVLFTTITMLFLIWAVKNAKQKGLTFQLIKAPSLAAMAKPLIYSLLAGIFLGIYILTWSGALLFVFVIFAYLVIQFIIDHLRRKPVGYLCFISVITFIVALLISLPSSPGGMFLASLIVAMVVPIVMAVLSYLMVKRNMKPIIYPATIIGLGLISVVIFRIASPSLFQAMIGSFTFFIWPIGTTVYEMSPLLLPFGNFSWSVAWANFTTSFFLCFVALGILIYSVVKRGETDKTLFVIWSLVILAAALSMRRFAYYLAINVALLTGYLSWLFLEVTGFRRLMTASSEAPKEIGKTVRDKKKWRGERRPAANYVNMVLGVIVVFVLIFYPNIGPLPGGTKPAIDTASNPQFAPSDAWCESLSWMRDNTPEPFDNPDFYYEFYKSPSPGEGYDFPQTAYGVTTWWDYGYWVTRIGRRIPTSNPGTGHQVEGYIFTAQVEETANKMLDALGSKYVIVDYAIVMPVSKFYALVELSGSKTEGFFDVYYQPQQDVLKPLILFYPEYYRSLVCRLYNFDGKQVVPPNTVVISYAQKVSREGQSYKEITGVKSFSDYSEAEAYIAAQESDNYRIVSSDPFASPVPLEALEHYKLVYSSEGTMAQPGGKLVSEVKIFEYIK